MNEIEFYSSDFVILDTETTGLDDRAEIVEISIILEKSVEHGICGKSGRKRQIITRR